MAAGIEVEKPPQPQMVDDQLAELQTHEKFWFLQGRDAEQIQDHRFVERHTLTEQLDIEVRAETRSGGLKEGKFNDDALFIVPLGEGRHLVCVLDGATSQEKISGLETHKVSGAFFGSHLISFGFQASKEYQELCAREDVTAGDAMRVVNRWLNKQFREIEGIDYENVLTIPGMAATFALIDANCNKITFAHVADSVACAVYADGRVERLTDNKNEPFDKKTMDLSVKIAKENGISLAELRKNKKLREPVKEHVQKSFLAKINTPGGCGILNGMDELVENGLIHETWIPITSDLVGIFLLSDGAYMPYLKAGVSVEDALRTIAQKIFTDDCLGQGFLLEGEAALAADPDFKKIPRLKHQDDGTIIQVLLFLHNVVRQRAARFPLS